MSKARGKGKNKLMEKKKLVKIVYPDLDEMPEDIYANNVRISHNPYDFVLYFGTIDIPPIIEGEKFDKEEVKAKVVARIRLTPKVTEGLLKALQTNLETFNKKEKKGN